MNKAVSDPASVPDQSLKDGVIPKGLPADLVQAMKINAQQQDQAPAQAPTSTVIQDINAKEQQQQAQAQQIDEQKLLQQLPTIMADLKVARDIAKEKGDKEEVKAVDQKIAEISMLAQRAQEKMQMQPAQGQGPMIAPPPQGIDAAMAQQQQQQAAMAQQPQQMAQAPQQAPQGIAQFYKGGEVKRYDGTTNGSVTKDDYPIWNLGDAISSIGSYMGKTYDKNKAINNGTYVPPSAAPESDYPAKPTQKDFDQFDKDTQSWLLTQKPTILPGSNKPAAPKASDAAKELNIPQYDVQGATNDVTNMVKGWSDMIMNQMNKDTSLQDFGRGLIRGGARWAGYTGAGTGLGQGIAGTGEGYLESTLASEAKKDKQLTQLMGLGLSGMDLRMKAAQLGISQRDVAAKEAEVPATIKYKEAMAYKAMHPTTTAGAPKGISSPVADKVLDRYSSYTSNPSSAPFYSSDISIPLNNGQTLTWNENDRKFLTKAQGEPAGQAALKRWEQVVEAKKNERLGQLYNLGGRNTAPSVYSSDE
jgi:hypothetical protein